MFMNVLITSLILDGLQVTNGTNQRCINYLPFPSRPNGVKVDWTLSVLDNDNSDLLSITDQNDFEVKLKDRLTAASSSIAASLTVDGASPSTLEVDNMVDQGHYPYRQSYITIMKLNWNIAGVLLSLYGVKS